jgi:hypothetical protein
MERARKGLEQRFVIQYCSANSVWAEALRLKLLDRNASYGLPGFNLLLVHATSAVCYFDRRLCYFDAADKHKFEPLCLRIGC